MHPKTKRNPRGAGRTPLPEADKMSRVTVSLPVALIEKLRKIGGGNLSVGIRLIARRHHDTYVG